MMGVIKTTHLYSVRFIIFLLLPCCMLSVRVSSQQNTPNFEMTNCGSIPSGMFCGLVSQYHGSYLKHEYSSENIKELVDWDIEHGEHIYINRFPTHDNPLFKWVFIERVDSSSCDDFDKMLSNDLYVEYMKDFFEDVQFLKKLNICNASKLSESSKRNLITNIRSILNDKGFNQTIPQGLSSILDEYEFGKSAQAFRVFPFNHFQDNYGSLPQEILSKLMNIVENYEDEEVKRWAVGRIQADNSDIAYEYLVDKAPESRSMLITATGSRNVQSRCNKQCLEILQIQRDKIEDTENTKEDARKIDYGLREIQDQQFKAEIVIESLNNFVTGMKLDFTYSHYEVAQILDIYNSLNEDAIDYLDKDYFYQAFYRTKEKRMIPFLIDAAQRTCNSNFYYSLYDSMDTQEYLSLGRQLMSACDIRTVSASYVRKFVHLPLTKQMKSSDTIELNILRDMLFAYADSIQFLGDCSQVSSFMNWFMQFQNNKDYDKAYASLWTSALLSGCVVDPEHVQDRTRFFRHYGDRQILWMVLNKPNPTFLPFLEEAFMAHLGYANASTFSLEKFARAYALLGNSSYLEKHFEEAESSSQKADLAKYLLFLGHREYEDIVIDEIATTLSGEEKFIALFDIVAKTCSAPALEMMYNTASAYSEDPRVAKRLLFSTAVGQVICEKGDAYETTLKLFDIPNIDEEDKVAIVPILVSIDTEDSIGILRDMFSVQGERRAKENIIRSIFQVSITPSVLSMLIEFLQEDETTKLERAMIWLNIVEKLNISNAPTFSSLTNVADLPFIEWDLQLLELSEQEIQPKEKEELAGKYRELALINIREFEAYRTTITKQILDAYEEEGLDPRDDVGVRMSISMSTNDIEVGYQRLVEYLLLKSDSLDPDHALTLAYMVLSEHRFGIGCNIESQQRLLEIENIEYPEVYHALGNAALCEKDKEAAKQYFLMALELDEDYYRAMFNLYIVEASLNNEIKALEYYQQARDLVLGTDDEYILEMLPTPKELHEMHKAREN